MTDKWLSRIVKFCCLDVVELALSIAMGWFYFAAILSIGLTLLIIGIILVIKMSLWATWWQADLTQKSAFVSCVYFAVEFALAILIGVVVFYLSWTIWPSILAVLVLFAIENAVMALYCVNE